MDISSTLNQNCCFKLAYSVLQFVLFVLSTQPQIIAAEENTLRNKGDCLPGWLTGGKSAHQMISTSISGLESMLTAHSRQNGCFLVRHPRDQAGLWNTLTTEDKRPPWKVNHSGECEQSIHIIIIIMFYSVFNHTHVPNPMIGKQDQHCFQILGWTRTLPFSFSKYCGCTRAIHWNSAH